jgi:hypothetical protein
MANSIITLYDDNNTINTTLSPDEEWVGLWSLIPQDHILQINGLVDSVGYLYVEYANEPDVTTHFIDPELGYTIGGLIPEVLVLSPAARFYRLHFVNGAFASNVVEIYPYFTRSYLQTAVHVLGNDGSDITITATTGGSVQAFMPAGTSTDQRVLAHIPRNTLATLRYISLSAFKLVGGGTPRVIFKVFVYNRDRQTRYEFFRLRMDTDVENNFALIDPIGLTVGPSEVI